MKNLKINKFLTDGNNKQVFDWVRQDHQADEKKFEKNGVKYSYRDYYTDQHRCSVEERKQDKSKECRLGILYSGLPDILVVDVDSTGQIEQCLPATCWDGYAGSTGVSGVNGASKGHLFYKVPDCLKGKSIKKIGLSYKGIKKLDVFLNCGQILYSAGTRKISKDQLEVITTKCSGEKPVEFYEEITGKALPDNPERVRKLVGKHNVRYGVNLEGTQTKDPKKFRAWILNSNLPEIPADFAEMLLKYVSKSSEANESENTESEGAETNFTGANDQVNEPLSPRQKEVVLEWLAKIPCNSYGDLREICCTVAGHISESELKSLSNPGIQKQMGQHWKSVSWNQIAPCGAGNIYNKMKIEAPDLAEEFQEGNPRRAAIEYVPDEQQLEVEENEYDEAIDAITDDATTSEDYENFKVQVTIVDETPRLACAWNKEENKEERLRIENWDEEREYYEKEGKGAKLALLGLMYGRIPVMVWFLIHSKRRTLKEQKENVHSNSIELPAKGSTIWAYAEVYCSKKGNKRHYQIFGYLRRGYQATDSKVEQSVKTAVMAASEK